MSGRAANGLRGASRADAAMKAPSAESVQTVPDGLTNAAVLADAAGQAAAWLKSLANPDRLLLLCLLVDGERNVSELEALSGIRQPSLSQQLGVLREEGIVGTRRDGKFIFYRIESPPALAVLNVLHATFCAPASDIKTRRTRRPEHPA